jgi:hypothetical protein
MESTVKVQIAIQLAFGTRRIALIVAIVGLKSTALVISTGIGTMIFPITHTDPTEFKFTTLTRHVVTPLILFNPRLAFGTALGIGQDPIGGFRFVSTLILPTS